MAKAAFNNDLNHHLKATELRLGLPGTDSHQQTPPPSCLKAAANNKRPSSEMDSTNPKNPKTQVVGWPPVRSYRKKNTSATPSEVISGLLYVKVSMDGAPYLRKIDLKCFKNYSQLLKALEKMFECAIGVYSETEGYNGSDHAPTYEDGDGDWMLVGDVPWDMFVTSCKRLRIIKGSEVKDFGRL